MIIFLAKIRAEKVTGIGYAAVVAWEIDSAKTCHHGYHEILLVDRPNKSE